MSESAGTDASSAPSGTLDAGEQVGADVDAGSLRGLVVDDEAKPLAGAVVGLLKTTFQVETDAGGAYAFLHIPVGEYTVVANRLGFESRGAKVAVDKDQTTWHNLTLVALATDEAHYVTSIHTAKLQCMLKAVVWVSSCSYPYTAVYLTAHQHGVNLSQYGAPPDIMDNKWRYNFSVGFGVKTVVSEMAWVPTSDLAKNLWLRQCKPQYDPILDDCPQLASATGASPLKVAWDPKAVAPKKAGSFGWIMSCVWPTFDSNPGVFLDQKIDMYNTAFYGAEAPEEWSILPPK